MIFEIVAKKTFPGWKNTFGFSIQPANLAYLLNIFLINLNKYQTDACIPINI